MKYLKFAGVAALFGALGLFVPSILTSQTPAAEDAKSSGPKLVNAEQSAKVVVTVYGSSYAQIQETRRVKLEAGHNRIQLDGIAKQYQENSLRIVSAAGPNRAAIKDAFTYLSATYQPANLNDEKLLAKSIGQDVTVVSADSNGKPESITGRLESVSGGKLVLHTADGKTSIVVWTNRIVLPVQHKDLSNTAALVVECEAKVAGDYAVTFFYKTGGIGWRAKHSLIFDEEKSVVENWQSEVSIVNNSGTTLKDATVLLLPASQNARGGEGRMYALSSGPGGAATRDATSETVGDQKPYKLPGQVTLVDGQSRQVPLFSANNVEVSRQYFIPSANSQYYKGDSKQGVNIRLTVENCEKKGLGKELPAGPVEVQQRNSDGTLLATGNAFLAQRTVDETFDLVIGTAADVKWEKKLVKAVDTTAPGPKRPVRPNQPEEVWQAKTYEVTVYNFKRNKDVEVKVEMYFPTDQTVGNPWTLKPSIEQAETTVKALKSDKGSVQYTVKEQVR